MSKYNCNKCGITVNMDPLLSFVYNILHKLHINIHIYMNNNIYYSPNPKQLLPSALSSSAFLSCLN